MTVKRKTPTDEARFNAATEPVQPEADEATFNAATEPDTTEGDGDE